jgi:hypothetical protein
MRLAMPLDPNEIGKIDAFAFDFTADMGAATMVSTNWTCGVAPFETATDPVPQSRVLSVSTQTAIQLGTPTDGSLQTRTGFFSVTSDGMPVTAAGGTDILEASAALSDGRVLKLDATVLSKPPGP